MPNLCLMMGISPTLFTFSSICLLTSVWSWCVIPETRGLTLTQVTQVRESIGEMQKRAIFHTFVESEAMYFIFRYLWPFLEGRKRQKSERLRYVDSSATKQQSLWRPRFKILFKFFESFFTRWKPDCCTWEQGAGCQGWSLLLIQLDDKNI